MQIYKFNKTEFDGVNAKLLYEDKFSKEICLSMAKNSFMKEHFAPSPIKVQVLKGSIEFGVGDEKVILSQFDMIALDSMIKHSLKANEDSIIRLSLSLNDTFSRVKEVLDK